MAEEVANHSIPRGGPIYVPNLVSSLNSVVYFQNSVLRELHELGNELDSDPSLVDEDFDLSVDDLKIRSDEELFEMALENVYKDGEAGKDGVKVSKKRSTEQSKKKKERPQSSNGTKVKKKKKKINEFHVKKSHLRKLKKFAKIKQKQDEDKAAAKLHCLSSGYKVSDTANPSSNGIERMQTLRSTKTESKVRAVEGEEYVPVVYPEVVLCVEVYHNVRRYIKCQEFLVLGQQTLTELRDNIYCSSDQVTQKAGNSDPSGYFLIENVFYNDLRDPSAIDYSEPILDWLESSKDEALKKWQCLITGKQLQQKQKAVFGSATNSQLPEFRAEDMHKTRFSNLKFRLGAGYLFCHQGDCKHRIVIRDMRLIHPEDVQNRSTYPILTFRLKHYAQKCNVCRIYKATKVTMDDKWAEENPCYFCDHCYALLHSEEGPSYSDFQLHEYVNL